MGSYLWCDHVCRWGFYKGPNFISGFSLICILTFSISFALYPIVASTFDFELAYNEGWNAYHQMVAATGGDIYHNASPYVATNYTPISFYVVGMLAKLGVDPITIGRVISELCFLALIALVGISARGLGASSPESLFGSAMCIALLGAYHREYIGIDDPQFLGSAVSLLGLVIYAYTRRSRTRNTVTLSVLIAGGLIKQTLLAVPIAISADLLLRDLRGGIKFVLQGTIIALVAALALYFSFGSACFSQLAWPRLYSVHEAATSTTRYLMAAGGSLPLMISFFAIYARSGRNRLALIYLLAALLVGAFLSGGAGTGSNMFIDLALASSIAAAVIARCLREDLHVDKRLIAAFLLVTVYGPALRVPYAVEELLEGLSGSLRAAQVSFDGDLDLMANYRGAAFCDSPMLCFRAGREFLLDPFNASQAIRLGRLDPAPLLEKVARGELAIIQLSTLTGHLFGPPLSGGPDVEREFRSLLDQRYRIARTSGRRVFYVPR
jgi:hypothetical protein